MCVCVDVCLYYIALAGQNACVWVFVACMVIHRHYISSHLHHYVVNACRYTLNIAFKDKVDCPLGKIGDGKDKMCSGRGECDYSNGRCNCDAGKYVHSQSRMHLFIRTCVHTRIHALSYG